MQIPPLKDTRHYYLQWSCRNWYELPPRGATPDANFSMATPLCIGDPYKARAGAMKRDRVVHSQAEPFRPAGAVLNNTGGLLRTVRVPSRAYCVPNWV